MMFQENDVAPTAKNQLLYFKNNNEITRKNPFLQKGKNVHQVLKSSCNLIS